MADTATYEIILRDETVAEGTPPPPVYTSQVAAPAMAPPPARQPVTPPAAVVPPYAVGTQKRIEELQARSRFIAEGGLQRASEQRRAQAGGPVLPTAQTLQAHTINLTARIVNLVGDRSAPVPPQSTPSAAPPVLPTNPPVLLRTPTAPAPVAMPVPAQPAQPIGPGPTVIHAGGTKLRMEDLPPAVQDVLRREAAQTSPAPAANRPQVPARTSARTLRAPRQEPLPSPRRYAARRRIARAAQIAPFANAVQSTAYGLSLLGAGRSATWLNRAALLTGSLPRTRGIGQAIGGLQRRSRQLRNPALVARAARVAGYSPAAASAVAGVARVAGTALGVALGPVGLAAGAVVGTFLALSAAGRRVNQWMLEQSKQLEKWSTVLAAANARAEMIGMRAEMRQAQRIAGPTAQAVVTEARSQAALSDIRTTLTIPLLQPLNELKRMTADVREIMAVGARGMMDNLRDISKGTEQYNVGLRAVKAIWAGISDKVKEIRDKLVDADDLDDLTNQQMTALIQSTLAVTEPAMPRSSPAAASFPGILGLLPAEEE